MADIPETTEWDAAWAALREMNDDAWDAESGRLDVLWLEEYRAEFVRYALTRRGWTVEDARDWAANSDLDARIENRGRDPVHVAQKEVAACEDWRVRHPRVRAVFSGCHHG
jgi:hypothetical protein